MLDPNQRHGIDPMMISKVEDHHEIAHNAQPKVKLVRPIKKDELQQFPARGIAVCVEVHNAEPKVDVPLGLFEIESIQGTGTCMAGPFSVMIPLTKQWRMVGDGLWRCRIKVRGIPKTVKAVRLEVPLQNGKVLTRDFASICRSHHIPPTAR